MNNYYRLKSRNPFKLVFVYIDHNNDYSNKIFSEYNLKVKEIMTMSKDGINLQLRFCKIRKRDTHIFEQAMNTLHKTLMLVTDLSEYNETCNEIESFAKV